MRWLLFFVRINNATSITITPALIDVLEGNFLSFQIEITAAITAKQRCRGGDRSYTIIQVHLAYFAVRKVLVSRSTVVS